MDKEIREIKKLVESAHAKLQRLEKMDKARDPACDLGAKVMKQRGAKGKAMKRPAAKAKRKVSKK
jgi:hypothetical protein